MIRCDETKPYIFVSYSHRDSEKVIGIMNRLRDEGYNVWYDGGIDPGTEWDDNIAKHVKDCTYFIAFVSQGYIGSDNCKDELNYSRDLDKDRLLVYLEDVDLPDGMAMRMNRIQAIWWNKYDASNIDEAYKKLYTTRGIERAKVFEKTATTGTEPVAQSVISTPVQSAVNVAPAVSSQPRKEVQEPQTAKKKLPIWPFIAGGAGVLVVLILVLVFALGGKKDYEGQTLEWYMEEANDGDETAMRYLADCYYEGTNGTSVDYAKAVEWYEKAAEDKENAADACFGIGNCYANGGNGITKDNAKAMEWFEKAVAAGNTEAYYRMGLIMYAGDAGATRDYAKSVEYFEKAIENGNTDAYYWMGCCYAYGDYGIEKDCNKALECYEKAVECGDTRVYLSLGDLYYSSSSTLKNRAKAVEYYDKAIENGHTDAYYWKALCYYYGDDTLTKDYAKCVESATQSAELGYAPAWIILALCYYEGDNGIELDNAKALEYYQKAEEKGANALKTDAVHMANYGTCYAIKGDYTKGMEWFQKAEEIAPLTNWKHLNAYGKCYSAGTDTTEPNYGLALEYYNKALQASYCDKALVYNNIGTVYANTKDYDNAMKYYEEAYLLGSMNSAWNMGNLYYYGYGVAQDYDKAVEYYLEAYNGGYSLTSSNWNLLALCYYYGRGVEQDYNKAVEYYKLALDLDANNKYVNYNIGFCYQMGQGVAQDIEQAKLHYQIAADQGHEGAQKALDSLQ